MNPPLKISIVIPTRNGAPYLRHCIESCLATNDAHIEVIVSNNNSTDNTQEVVKKFQDLRLCYFHTGANLSMRQNFEFALSKVTGDYAIFIGDDDGLLKNGLASLRHVLEKHKPDVVNWRHITYKWPKSAGGDSLLKFRPRDFFGPLYIKSPQNIFTEFCSAQIKSYRDAAHIYHGAVSMSLVNKVREKSGQYFMGQIPDVYTSLANLAHADSFMWMRHPVTIGGESPKSNGAATTSKTQTQEQSDLAKSFIQLAQEDTVTPEINLSIRLIVAYIYADLIRVNTLLLKGKDIIDHAAWRVAILDENDKQPEPLRTAQKSLLYPFFEKADPTFKAPPVTAPAIPPPPAKWREKETSKKR